MIDKLGRLDQLVAMIDDENLREEITDIFFEVLIYYGKDLLTSELADNVRSEIES